MNTYSSSEFVQEGAYLRLADGTRWPVAGGRLMVNTETERVRSANVYRPDVGWTWTCPAGHVHQYVPDEDHVLRLPSLVKRTRRVDCDGSCYSITHGDCEGHDVTEWFCRECDAQVGPGFIHDDTAETIGIAMSTISRYELAIEVGAGSPGGTTIITATSGEPLIGPFEGAAFAYTDETGHEYRMMLPPMRSDGTSERGSDGVTMRVGLHGENWQSANRKPTGP